MPRIRTAAVATAVAAAAIAAAVPHVASAEENGAQTIEYSDVYLKLIAAFPSGWVWDPCGAVLEVTRQVGVCSATLAPYPMHFYPDGTFGKMPWHPDASSPTGWRVEPDPCDALTDEDDRLWGEYQSYLWGYSDTRPDLTAAQIALYESCWPIGF